MDADVVVIGGGMAGAVAALRAVDLGANVILVRRGFGSTAMSSGTVDIAGPTNFLPLDPWDALPSIPAALRKIVRTNPFHPYSIVAGGRDRTEYLQAELERACEFAFGCIPELGFTGSVERNLALPNVVGTAKFCAFAPRSLAGGNLVTMRDARLLLVGIKGLALFRADTCRHALGRYSLMHTPASISRVDTAAVELPDRAASAPSAPFEVAQRFDHPSVMKDFTARLKENIRSDTTHIGVPPVLGIANHAEIFETMSSELHPRLFEVIVPEFAIHGQRLQASLDGALRRSGVRITTVEVRDVTTNGAKIKDLRLGNMNATLTASGASYIVATGKFGSGGLVAGDYLRDPLFGLPLFVDGECVDKRPVRELVRPHVTGKQPFLSCGLHIDDSLRPLDRQGRPAFENLFAAGSVIGEYDYVAERCGLGVAILTGYLAGQQAAERSAAGG